MLESNENTGRKLRCTLPSEESPIRKAYMLCDSGHVTSWKRRNYADNGKVSDCQGGRGGEKRWAGGAERIFRAMKILCISWYWNDRRVIIHFPKPIEYITERVNPKMNYELRMINMCQWMFILGKKMCHSGVNLIKGKAMHVWGQGLFRKYLHLPPNFAVKLKLL